MLPMCVLAFGTEYVCVGAHTVVLSLTFFPTYLGQHQDHADGHSKCGQILSNQCSEEAIHEERLESSRLHYGGITLW